MKDYRTRRKRLLTRLVCWGLVAAALVFPRLSFGQFGQIATKVAPTYLFRFLIPVKLLVAQGTNVAIVCKVLKKAGQEAAEPIGVVSLEFPHDKFDDTFQLDMLPSHIMPGKNPADATMYACEMYVGLAPGAPPILYVDGFGATFPPQ